MKFEMLFPAVLIYFPNSKVCLIGEWSIRKDSEVQTVAGIVTQNYVIWSQLFKAGLAR